MSSILEKKKLEEAEQHVKDAEKYLKTSPLKLKFSPEWDPAGDSYSRAATCYKVAKQYEESKKCLLKAVDCYKEIHSIFQAGKMLEQAVLVSRDMDSLDEISQLAERGALMYRQVNKPEAAAQLLEKAAKILEKTKPEDAIGLYEKASETVSVEDRPNVAGEYSGKAGRMCVRTKDWDRAVTNLRKAIIEAEINWRSEGGSNPNQAVMGLFLIELIKGDRVGAEKIWRELGAWADGEQTRSVQNIIEGYDNQDGEMVSTGLDSQAIRGLDLDFARLARELPRPKGTSSSGATASSENGGAGAEEEDDNELSGLC